MFLSDAVTALLTELCCLVLRKQRSRTILSGNTCILIKARRTSDHVILIDEGATNRCKQQELLATEDAFDVHLGPGYSHTHILLKQTNMRVEV